MTMVEFAGQAVPLGRDDISEAARSLDVDEAVVRGIIEVEAAGKWHDAWGRPIMRFEDHVFRRKTGRDVDGHANDWDTLFKAVRIAEAAALESASFGGPQIMGFNHAIVGYPSAKAMVEAFAESAGAQLDALVAFIKDNSRLWRAAQTGDWATFARIYNGPGYAKNAYDVKLREAVQRWRDKLGRSSAPINPPLPGRKPTETVSVDRQPWWRVLLDLILSICRRRSNV